MSGRVRVRIDELVLDGVAGDPAEVGAAVEAALARRLAGQRPAAGSSGRVEGGIVGVDGPTPAVAERIAASIERSLR